MRKKRSDAVVVITGASSGIGKAAALELAGRGAALVLAARRPEALEAAAAECRELGARALAVPTDVADEAAVRELVRRALAEYGRIDAWINNAAVMAAGRFAETSPEAFRRVMETNFFGYVHGARAALPVFRRQGRGVLINNASMMARLAEPYFSAYVASKHAVRGLGMSLRQELHLEQARRIHVCTLMPAAIDTPFFQHSANYSGRVLQAIPPVYPAAKVAKAMADCIENPRREFFVGNAGRLFNLQFRLSQAWGERLLARAVARLHFRRYEGTPATDGNVLAPMAGGTGVSGGWLPGPRRRRLRRGATAAFAVGAAALLAALFRRMRPRFA